MFGGGALVVLLLLFFIPLGDDAATDSSKTDKPQTEATTGRNVQFVEYNNNEGKLAHFVEEEAGKWAEIQGNNQVFARFQEIKRDDKSVYLRDISRDVGVTIELDLVNKQIKYNDDRGKAAILYDITSYH
jgi:hypothetical protein